MENYQTEQQKRKPFNLQFTKSQFLKRSIITKLILSVSVVSFFFTHSTLLSFLHYLNFYFSTLPIKLFSHTLDKNSTFLLCNGLLVFLAKYSGFFGSSSSPSPSSSNKYNPTADHHESFKNYEGDEDGSQSQSQMAVMETTNQVPLLEKEDGVLENIESTQQNAMERRGDFEYKSEEVPQEEENEKFKVEDEHEEAQEGLVWEERADEQEEETKAALEEEEALVDEEQEGSFFIEEVEAREEEEANGLLSTAELNKKFDDFIRKMKEELRIEARQQLILV